MQIGLNGAIVLQQVHYWVLKKKEAKKDYFQGHFWIYNTYSQWETQFPFWSKSTIRRTIKDLEDRGLLLNRNLNKAGYDKTKWYTVNYDALNDLIQRSSLPSAQNEQDLCSNWTVPCVQNEQTNTIDKPEISPDNLNGLNGTTSQVPQRHSFATNYNLNILEKQIKKSCRELGIENSAPYIEIIAYYYTIYQQTFGREHPPLSTKALDSVIVAIRDGTDMLQDCPLDVDCYHAMIDKHFQTEYADCDYNICHFMTEGIRNNRFYETCY